MWKVCFLVYIGEFRFVRILVLIFVLKIMVKILLSIID